MIWGLRSTCRCVHPKNGDEERTRWYCEQPVTVNFHAPYCTPCWRKHQQGWVKVAGRARKVAPRPVWRAYHWLT